MEELSAQPVQGNVAHAPPHRFAAPSICPLCRHDAAAFDVVDFNKSCIEARGARLPLSGIPIYYHRCPACDFCFAPEFGAWSAADFRSRIYNAGYAEVDPDYPELRPRANADWLSATFPRFQGMHLDYGGGSGVLAAALARRGWNSVSCDPFADERPLNSADRFDLITAFEVFEHVADPRALLETLVQRLAPTGLIVLTTTLADGNIVAGQRLAWWYAAPRNGHISLYGKRSMQQLAAQANLQFGSFSNWQHLLWNSVPTWAAHLFPDRSQTP